MRLSKPFIRLPFRFDADRLAEEVRQFAARPMDGTSERLARQLRHRAHFQRRRRQRLLRGREETDAASRRMRVHAPGDGEFRASAFALAADEARRALGTQPARRLQLPLVQPGAHSHPGHHPPVGDLPLRSGAAQHARRRMLDIRLLAAPQGRQCQRRRPHTPRYRHLWLVAILEHGANRRTQRPVGDGRERRVHRLRTRQACRAPDGEDSRVCR